jgi:branched-chain amino acid transport system ATP-binding protein
VTTTASASTAGALLRATDVSVTYGRSLALSRLSFDLQDGGLVLVLGPNGAGKTSLLRALAGASIARARGRIVLDNKDLGPLPAFKRVRLGISLVPEGRGTLPGLSVYDNLDLGWHAAPAAHGRLPAADLERVFELFSVLRERLSQDCSTLSGGEMQMLAIARALLSRPRVLLLDEPSLGLAPQAIARVYEALAELNRAGLAMVLVEQKAVPLWRAPDSTIVLHSGRVLHRVTGKRPSEEELAALYLGEGAA